MASLQPHGSAILPKGKGLFPSIAPRIYHLSPRSVSLQRNCRFTYPSFISPKRLLIPWCVKTNGATPPELESNSGEEFEISNSNLNEVHTTKSYAKLHDFCLGIPYGGLLFIMGLIGFIIVRSPISLVLGVVPGFGIVAFGWLSMMFWRNSKSNFIFIVGQAVIAGFLAWQYSQAFSLTQKFLPWGLYAFLSGAMVCFYVYVLLSGGNPPPGALHKDGQGSQQNIS